MCKDVRHWRQVAFSALSTQLDGFRVESICSHGEQVPQLAKRVRSNRSHRIEFFFWEDELRTDSEGARHHDQRPSSASTHGQSATTTSYQCFLISERFFFSRIAHCFFSTSSNTNHNCTITISSIIICKCHTGSARARIVDGSAAAVSRRRQVSVVAAAVQQQQQRMRRWSSSRDCEEEQ